MLQEQNNDLMLWWEDQAFAGKELFRLDPDGAITLKEQDNIKERTVGTIADENKDVVLVHLQEKFATVESRFNEMQVEWVAAEDKLKLADKVTKLKEYLLHVNAMGDFSKPYLLLKDWMHTIYTLTEENLTERVKLAEMAEALTTGKEWRDAMPVFREITEKWKTLPAITDRNKADKLWNRIEAARKAVQELRRLGLQDEEKDLLANMDLKIELAEQAEAMSSSEEWKKTTESFHRLTKEWQRIGHTHNKKNEELWNRFINAKRVFFDRKREHYEQLEAQQEGNLAIKTELANKAEELKDSKEWSKTAQAYAALMDQWKKTGPVPHEHMDTIWKKFIDAHNSFFDAKKIHTGEIRTVQESNYQLKKGLLERTEAIKNSSLWSDTINEMNELMEEWKRIGPVPREYGDTLWEEFNAARKYFFGRVDANRQQRKQQRQQQTDTRKKYDDDRETDRKKSDEDFAKARKEDNEARIAAKKQQEKDAIATLERDIKEEKEKLADFTNGLENITPGKKAAELKAHLENLIKESEQHLKKLESKYAQVKKDNQPKKESELTLEEHIAHLQPAAGDETTSEPE